MKLFLSASRQFAKSFFFFFSSSNLVQSHFSLQQSYRHYLLGGAAGGLSGTTQQHCIYGPQQWDLKAASSGRRKAEPKQSYMFAIRGRQRKALEMFTLRAEAGDHPPHKQAGQVIAVAIFFLGLFFNS